MRWWAPKDQGGAATNQGAPAVALLAFAVKVQDFDLAIVRPVGRVVQLERHWLGLGHLDECRCRAHVGVATTVLRTSDRGAAAWFGKGSAPPKRSRGVAR
eukprot:scaffold37173_cov69-Phaeocystis_antarctica.AAC.4